MPKYHWIALLARAHLRIAPLVVVAGRGGRADDARSQVYIKEIINQIA
jgi:hypothetical protein